MRFASPRDARAQGIETVYQDLALIGDLSVYHNMFLGREYHKRILGLKLLDNAKMRDLAVRHISNAGDLDPQREQHGRSAVGRATPVRRRRAFDLFVADHPGAR